MSGQATPVSRPLPAVAASAMKINKIDKKIDITLFLNGN
jgi:hypothetical protein